MTPTRARQTALLAAAPLVLLGTLAFLVVKTQAIDFQGDSQALALLRDMLAAAKPAQPAADELEEEEADKVRVLFVDDEEKILNALRALFRSDYHVFTALNGTEALQLIKEHDIPVVVSDQRMRPA